MAQPFAGRGLPRELPRRCRARGAAAVTVRPRRHTRARERRGARSSPSPARPAASALSAWGAAVVAAAALRPAQPRSPLGSRPEGTSQQTSRRRPLPHRLPAPRDVSTFCRTEHATRHAPSARKISTRTPPGEAPPPRRVSSHSLSQGRRMLAVVATTSYALQSLETDSSLPRPSLDPLGGGFREADLALELPEGLEHALCSVEPRDPLPTKEHPVEPFGSCDL